MTVNGVVSGFWEDFAADLQDPVFLRDYVVEAVRIATIDRVVIGLDEAREAAGLSKAELARAIGAEPATIRRLFAHGHSNPTLGTLAEVASVLGMRVTLEAMDAEEQDTITAALRSERTRDARGLHDQLAVSASPR